jgi:hypothetical protein
MAETSFTDLARLRELLLDLCTNPARSWRTDPDAAALVEFCAGKYAGLARAYGQSPHDAAVAAFFELRRPRLLEKDDPWAFVTTSVEAYLKAHQRADEQLVGERTARHRQPATFHGAARLDDRSWSVLADTLPAEREQALADRHAPHLTPAGPIRPVEVDAALGALAWMLAVFGWSPESAAVALEYITDRLATAGSRRRARTYLRRDRRALSLLDLTQDAWLALVTAVLGNTDPDLDFTGAGRGLLMLLVLGHSPWDLLGDEQVAGLLAATAPAPAAAGREAVVSGA